MEGNIETNQPSNGISNTSTNEDAAVSEESINHSSENTESDADGSKISPPSESPPNQSPVLRRSSRVWRPPTRYGEYVSYPDCYTSSSDSD